MSDDRDDESPTRDALKGIGLLFRAGRHAARRVKKEIETSDLAKSIENAGNDVARAVDNVVGRITGDVKRPTPRPPKTEGSSGPPADKPKGPTPEDPGYWIADDDDKKKPSS